MPYRGSIELVATGSEFKVDEFVATYGASRERCWYSGERIGKTSRRQTENGCSILLGELNDGAALDAILNKNIPAIMSWAEAATCCGGDIQLSVVIRTDGDDYPGLNFSSEIIDALSAASVSLDIDIIPSL